MSKEPYNYYDEYRRNDEIINEQKEVSDFAKFAKQFQPRYEDEKRHAEYEKFFSERSTDDPLTIKLKRIIAERPKKRPERTIGSD